MKSEDAKKEETKILQQVGYPIRLYESTPCSPPNDSTAYSMQPSNILQVFSASARLYTLAVVYLSYIPPSYINCCISFCKLYLRGL